MKHFALFILSFLAWNMPAQILFSGDTNNDGVANYLDLLPIGLAYGFEGFPRPGATIDWFPQPYTPWGMTLPVSGIDLAFIDADGNGFIDTLDIEAIPFNYDSTQFSAIPEPKPYHLKDTFFVDELPELRLEFDRDSALEGDTVQLIISYIYPPGLPPTAGALGTGFALEFPEELVKDSLLKVFPDTLSGDLMFVAANVNFSDAWRAIPPGRVEMAAAGRGGPALNQNREIARMEIVIEDMILQLQESKPLPVEVVDWLLINPAEQVIEMKRRPDTLIIYKKPNAVSPELSSRPDLQISPNPSSGRFRLEFGENLSGTVRIFGREGSLVYEEKMPFGKTFDLDLSHLAKSIYFLRFQTDKGVLMEKLMLFKE